MQVVFVSEVIWAVKIPVKLQSRQRKVRLGPRLQGEGILQISDMHFPIALTFEHVAGFGRVPFSELGGQLTKNKRR